MRSFCSAFDALIGSTDSDGGDGRASWRLPNPLVPTLSRLLPKIVDRAKAEVPTVLPHLLFAPSNA
jgi:hypothetical protein